MFCPKCGSENPDTNKFCRSCRENLLVVAQAIKGRMPVMIAGKLDAALERLSERFRRDSILWLTFSIGMLILAAVDFGWRPTSSRVGFDLLLATTGFLAGGWSSLAYKRSLANGSGLEPGEPASGFESTKPQLQLLFCPACGVKIAGLPKHCSSCGANLDPLRSAVRPNRWRVIFNRLLDKYIGIQSDKVRIHQNVRQMMIFPFVYLAMGILGIYKDRNPTWLLFSFMFLVTVLWDRAASRRWFTTTRKSDTKSQDEPGLVRTTDELAFTPALAASSMSITEEITRRFEPAIIQSQEEMEARKLQR